MGKGGGRSSSSSSSRGSPGMFSSKGLGPKSTTSTPSHSAPKMPSSVTPTNKSPVPVANKSTPNHQPVQPQQNRTTAPTQSMAPSGGGSMLGSIATNIVSTAGGVFLGHALMDAWRGTGTKEEKMAEAFDANDSVKRQELQGPCADSYNIFTKCVENSNQNISACQWAYDMFAQCKNPNAVQNPPKTYL